MEASGRYRIELYNNWSLEDLYRFPRAYEQVYFFFTSIDPTLDVPDRERIIHTYEMFPWQGGYSSVNFFDGLKFATPVSARPKIIAIHKASPGYLDLGLWVGTALALGSLIKTFASSIDAVSTTYNNIYKGMHERKLLKVTVKKEELLLNSAAMEFINKSNQQMANVLDISSHVDLDKLTGSPYLSLKISLSVYRRLQTLSDYERRGKASFTQGNSRRRVQKRNRPIS